MMYRLGMTMRVREYADYVHIHESADADENLITDANGQI